MKGNFCFVTIYKLKTLFPSCKISIMNSSQLYILFTNRWTKNRVVTSMDWSAVFPELLVASYDKNPDAAHDPDGVCLVWNTRFKKTTPEDIFHCQVLIRVILKEVLSIIEKDPIRKEFSFEMN